jgi:predicted fused transcriptional regulator/phosphomethylpyrimidine kinase
MTVPACLRLADEVFPRVRAIAVHRLVGQGWSQSRAGDAVGLSQAMVSRHLSTRVPEDPVAQRLAEDLCAALESPPTPATGPSAWCSTLTVGQDRPGGEAALADLLTAERSLRAAPPLRVMPQVGLNVARALPSAASADDVLAFPGRLVEAGGGRIVSPAPPAFGGSGHLARCLLAVRRAQPGILALANVRGGNDVQAAAKRLGWTVVRVARSTKGTGTGEAPVLAAMGKGRATQAWHDPGAVGLEACLYVAGSDAAEVAARIAALDAEVRA